MVFTSYAFAALFAVVLAWRVFLGRTNREFSYLLTLLISSLIFYAWHIPECLLILLFSCVIDYVAAEKIDACRQKSQTGRKYLILSLATNLGVLGYFKYTNFALDAIRKVLLSCGAGVNWVPHLDVILPMGISFYTFQSMSYTIDVYRGQLPPMRSFWKFLLYVSFFPQLVAGPIVRGTDFLYQMKRRRGLRAPFVLEGLYLVIQGFFLKMVVADNLGAYVDRFWAFGAEKGSGATAPTLLAVLFSCQIFADFAGYSSIARGLAYLLGFRFPLNFNSPYLADSFKDFWARWHITLSTWLREYLYIPLGGNRISPVRTYINLLLTMLLGGLWHGAAMTFVIWGALHGAALIAERMLGLHTGTSRPRVWKWVLRFSVVQAVILITWIFFRSESTSQATRILRNIFVGGLAFESAVMLLPALIFAVPVVLMHVRALVAEKKWFSAPSTLEKSCLAAVMFYAIVTMYGNSTGFIYFQF
jgi:alginate O-acetyltransferase complex protein AlgI